MAKQGSRQRSVQKRIVVASVPIALVGLLSSLPQTSTTLTSGSQSRSAAAAAEVGRQAVALPAAGETATPEFAVQSDDNTPPTVDLASLSVSPKVATKENPPVITVHATDDTGLYRCSIACENVETGMKRYFNSKCPDNSKDYTFEVELTVDDDILSGKWRVCEIDVNDEIDNFQHFYNKWSYENKRACKNNYYKSIDLSMLDFEVTGTNAHYPRIDASSLSVSTKDATIDNPPTFTVKITDCSEEIQSCSIYFRNYATYELEKVVLSPIDGDMESVTWTGTLNVRDYMPSGLWIATSIDISCSKNSSNYILQTYNIYASDYCDEPQCADLSPLDFTLSGTHREIPSFVVDISSLSVSTKNATVDDPPTVTVTINDYNKDYHIKNARIYYHIDGHVLWFPLLPKNVDEHGNGTWQSFPIDVRSYQYDGLWRCSSIYIFDAFLNHEIYFPDSREFPPHPNSRDLSAADFELSCANDPQNQVTITFIDGLGGIAFEDTQVVANVGDRIQPVACPSLPGYTFMGWDPPFDYTATRDVTYTAKYIKDGDDAKDISTLEARLTDSVDGTYVYEPGGVTPMVEVRDGDKALAKGVDYDVFYEGNDRVGQAAAVVRGMGSYGGTKTLGFTITPADITHAASIAAIAPQTLGSGPVRPKVIVRYARTILDEGIDYDLEYTGNDRPGTATVTVRGKGNYTGEVSSEFEVVAPRSLDDASVYVERATFTYDGITDAPEISRVAFDDGTTLIEGTDYVIEGRNANVGQHTLTLRGVGAYEGQSKTVPFEVKAAPISEGTIHLADRYVRKDAPAEPTPVIEYNGATLREGVDYTLSWSRRGSYYSGPHQGVLPADAGSVTATGIGNFEGSLTRQFEIVDGADDLSGSTVTLQTPQVGTFIYDGTDKRPDVTVTLGEKTLVEGVDYDVEYTGNTRADVGATVVVTCRGDYAGMATATFEISPRPAVVRANPATKEEGEADPALTATVEGTIGSDRLTFTLTRRAGEEPGTYPIEATGATNQGNYTVTFEGSTFTIEESTVRFSVSELPSFIYIGSQITPTVSVSAVDGTPLTKDLDYTVTYGENLHAGAGAGSVTVRGLGRYRNQTETRTFDITQRDATIRPNDARKAVGQDDPALGWVASGLAGTDTVTGVTVTRDSGEAAGTYAIRATGGRVLSASGADVTADYDLSYETGTFTVTGSGSTTPETPEVPVTPACPSQTFLPMSMWSGWGYPAYEYGYRDPLYLNPYSLPTRTYYGDDTSSSGTTTTSGSPSVSAEARPSATRQASQTSSTTGDAASPATVAGTPAVSTPATDTTASTSAGTSRKRPSARRTPAASDEQAPATNTESVSAETKGTASERPSATRPAGDATADATERTTDKGAASGRVTRHSGADRYATMASCVGAAFDRSDWVVVASGEDYADALSAVALAGAHDAPVVLTARESLSAQAETEVRRLGATHAVVVGGEAAVSGAVEDALRGIVGDVTRVAGADRTATSVAVLRAVRAARGAADTVVVASGASFADALSAGPWAWRTASPIVLAGPDGTLTDEAVEAIREDGGFKLALVVGGESAVSDAVRGQLGDGLAFAREGGADRYDTSALVADFATTNGLGWTEPVVATGTGFADALAGAALAGRLGSPLLLVGADGGRAVAEVGRHAGSVRQVHVLGGTSAVPASVEDALRGALS